MVSDAISHSVLLGIVLAFFIVRDVSSPWLIAGAALFGVLTVFSVEMLSETGLVKSDDAVGIVFPLFFSLAVILITKYARNVHLDTDMVLMGEVIMAPLYRMSVFGISLPRAFVQMCVIFLFKSIVFQCLFAISETPPRILAPGVPDRPETSRKRTPNPTTARKHNTFAFIYFKRNILQCFRFHFCIAETDLLQLDQFITSRQLSATAE